MLLKFGGLCARLWFRMLQSTRRMREPREQVSQPLNSCTEETHSRILSVSIRLKNTRLTSTTDRSSTNDVDLCQPEWYKFYDHKSSARYILWALTITLALQILYDLTLPLVSAERHTRVG